MNHHNLTNKQVADFVSGKKITGIETREIFNEQYGRNWTMTGFVISDGTFVAIATDEEPSFIIVINETN